MSSNQGRSVRLSSLDLAHVRFLDRLIERRVMSEDQGVALLSQEFVRRPGCQELLPISNGLLRTIASQVRRGCRRITIWTDEVGKRYVTAEPPP